ncbi:MAG: ATP-binding protein [Verrucomicrobia bacterium]|nr:ATP-binding protein [Verrucomicrobiota bacterium]
MLGSLFAVGLISRLTTGEILPSDPKSSLIFQNALLLIVLGSALLEHHFTKPADSAVNGLMAMLTLVPVYGLPSKLIWWLVFLYCGIVCVFAMTCVAVSSGPTLTGWRKRIADLTKQPSVIFGKSRVLYSVVFIYAVISFYGVQSKQTAILVLFWGAFIALWPLGVPELLSAFSAQRSGFTVIGRVVRTDAPNIIHATIESDSKWDRTAVKVLQQGDGKQRYVLPLFCQSKDNQILGTGLCLADVDSPLKGLEPSCLYEPVSLDKTAEQLLGGGKDSRLVGFVDQESTIAQLRFHTWNPTDCKEGMLTWAEVGSERVFYQITEGLTEEENLETDRHGYQIATASQLGTLNPEKGFEKFGWLPAMNTPVFAVPKGFGADMVRIDETDFKYGNVPETSISVTGAFADMLEYHTAILGVTGSGKTELAFDLLRHALTHETKVICIDLTARYAGRLNDLNPHDLSITPALSADLGRKLGEVETTPFPALADKKKILNEFSEQLRKDVSKKMSDFLTSPENDKKLGIITLNEISNTKVTLLVTEFYLTSLLSFARDNPNTCPRVLLVVEEAHTVIPETTTMGLGDNDSKGLVAKIAQIALQGRKYQVGLLVIAQRTANVSKTVLTQCNTIVSFSCFDDTSLGFFKNFYGQTHTAAIPNLQFLQAVAFGKGVKCQRPIIFQVPFDEKKAALGKRKETKKVNVVVT